MKTILLFLTLISSLFALSINESLLKVHSTLVPKIYLMDYKFKDKVKDNAIAIAIMYKENEYKDAKRLKGMIENKYKDGIRGYKVKPELVKYKDIKTTEVNIYYLFPTNSEEIKEVVNKASTVDALTFAYNRDDLKHGVMISLNVSKKIEPLLNLEAIQTNRITFRPVLIDISSIYINNLDSVLKQINLRGSYFYRIYQA